jgi:hypothetical protein
MESELRKELAEERRQKGAVEREKRRIESELENLTTALFEEANTVCTPIHSSASVETAADSP